MKPQNDRRVTLFHSPQSRSAGALILLEELGADYELHVLNLRQGEQRKAASLAVNPMGKVPAIRHGDTIVTECAAICAYLAETFPEKALAPKQEERARYYRWMFFAAGPLESAVTSGA